MNQFLYYAERIVQNIFILLPIIIICLIGIRFALKRRKAHPQVSSYVILALSIKLVWEILQIPLNEAVLYFDLYNSQKLENSLIWWMMTLFHYVIPPLVETLCISLLLMAVFDKFAVKNSK